jgi:AraC-like DNA-binding protein
MQHVAVTRESRRVGERRADLVEQVRAAVQERLGAGRPSKTSIARSLGMSGRTLHRRLAEAGTTYDRVVHEARARRALELLVRPGVGTYDVAMAAGYRGTASFFRAFRAWTGMTPAAYRAVLAAEAPQPPRADAADSRAGR